jgi:hypothetical protein
MLVRLQDALEEQERPERERDVLLRRRAEVIENVWRPYYGTNPNAPDAYSLPGQSVREFVLRPLITHRFVAVLRVWADLVLAARPPWSQHAQGIEEIVRRHEIDREERSSNFLRPFSFILMKESAVWFFEEEMRPDRLITDRAARVAVAVARFQRDHGDALPGALDELVPDYLDEVPSDPLSDGPLRYRLDLRSYVIYSVGPDGTDDGGALVRETAPGNIRRFAAGPDIGVRVLIGEQTRRSGN